MLDLPEIDPHHPYVPYEAESMREAMVEGEWVKRTRVVTRMSIYPWVKREYVEEDPSRIRTRVMYTLMWQ